MKFIHALVLIVSAIGLSSSSMAETHPFTNFLRKIDRQLCDKYHSSKCRHHKPNAVHSKTKNAPSPPPPDSVAKPVQPIVPSAVPVPTLKPEPPHQNALPIAKPNPPIAVPKTPIAAPKPPSVVPIPVPTLKPEPPAKKLPIPAIVGPLTPPAPVLPPAKISPVPPVVAPPVPVAPPAPVAIERPADPTCLATLKVKGVDFESVPQPPGLPACIVVQPVKLKSIQMDGFVLKLPEQPTFNCVFALRFASWLQESGGPLAAVKEGSSLTQLNTGPGYQCRGRNGDISAKISEHGFGNAVDIERMKFADGKVFLVHDALDATTEAYETLKALRASACGTFSTVLGPGANEAHREHFHFDLAVRGKSGTFKICE